jgi:hypothetical protein
MLGGPNKQHEKAGSPEPSAYDDKINAVRAYLQTMIVLFARQAICVCCVSTLWEFEAAVDLVLLQCTKHMTWSCDSEKPGTLPFRFALVQGFMCVDQHVPVATAELPTLPPCSFRIIVSLIVHDRIHHQIGTAFENNFVYMHAYFQ